MVIHPTAIVDSNAKIGEAVEIGPYSIVENDVEIGANTRIADHVVVKKGTRIGTGCNVHSNCVIGDDPQYIGFNSSIRTGVVIGEGCTIRENVTIHRSIYEGKHTLIDNQVYLMVGSHVAHDCVLQDKAILTNNVMLAGHVYVGRNAYVGGGAAIHQFVRLGEGSMTGGSARVTMDVAPYLIVSERNEVSGLNLVGLKRRNVPRENIKELKALFHLLLETHGNIRQQARNELAHRAESLSAEARIFLEFFEEGKRGFCGVQLKRK
jgi:UDP-N-acetylglucosamine acyltransferase